MSALAAVAAAGAGVALRQFERVRVPSLAWSVGAIGALALVGFAGLLKLQS